MKHTLAKSMMVAIPNQLNSWYVIPLKKGI